MSIDLHAQREPAMAAATTAERGRVLTFDALRDLSVRLACALRKLGLREGDRIAILLGNENEYFAVAWAARRAGLRYVPVNWHLGVDEAAHIVADSDSRALVASQRTIDQARRIAERLGGPEVLLTWGRACAAFESVETVIAAELAVAPADEREGIYMFYSSGTTGHPKGVLRSLPDRPFGAMLPVEAMLEKQYGWQAGIVFLTPAPLYHAAPLGWSMATQIYGGTAVIMEHFDAQATLEAIETHRVTHALFVPTHFVRMLKLPEAIRRRYDLSSLKMVIHAAAPCAIAVKEAMLDWLGPIVHEYYSATEGGGYTAIGPEEWMRRKGSVGRSIGKPIHILDESGAEVPTGQVGYVYFEDPERFEYHKAPERTHEYFNSRGWGTMGDMGWVDAEGYLFLADRKSHMIISGGVNIYPQEIEDALALHPAVADVAVIGVPDEEFGEVVKAVVVAAEPARAGPELADAIIADCRARFAGYKCPRSVDFVHALPRLPTGKLLKRAIRKWYWGDAAVQINS